MPSSKNHRLNIHNLLRLAEAVATEYFAGEVDPITLASVAYIESGGDPSAVRYEPSVDSSSVGLCQTMLLTARWLVTDTTPKLPPEKLVCRPVGAPIPRPPEIAEPSQLTLMDPFTSMWYGAAYLAYLSVYGLKGQTEEWMIRAYNAGPTGVQIKNTDAYWRKFRTTKRTIESGLRQAQKGGGLHQVEEGNTMYGIAQVCEVSLKDLLKVNPQIEDSSQLQVGQLLVLPGSDSLPSSPKITARNRMLNRSASFASLHSLASHKSSLSVFGAIRRRWPWQAQVALTAGCLTCAGLLVYALAGSSERSVKSGTRNPRGCNEERSAGGLPGGEHSVARKGKGVHILRDGETLSGIARDYQIPLGTLLAANTSLSNPDKVNVGTLISLPSSQK